MREFLWRGNSEAKKTHLITWDVVYSEISKGGLEIRPLCAMNTALLVKLVWRIYSNYNTLWSKALRPKYLDSNLAERVFLTETSSMGSIIWNDIIKVMPYVV